MESKKDYLIRRASEENYFVLAYLGEVYGLMSTEHKTVMPSFDVEPRNMLDLGVHTEDHIEQYIARCNEVLR